MLALKVVAFCLQPIVVGQKTFKRSNGADGQFPVLSVCRFAVIVRCSEPLPLPCLRNPFLAPISPRAVRISVMR